MQPNPNQPTRRRASHPAQDNAILIVRNLEYQRQIEELRQRLDLLETQRQIAQDRFTDCLEFMRKLQTQIAESGEAKLGSANVIARNVHHQLETFLERV